MESDSSSSHISEVTVEAPEWDSAVTDPEGVVGRAVRAALAAADPGGPAEVSVLLADDARLRELNRTWRGEDKPTNVLSFPARDGAGGGWPDLPPGGAGPVPLGDVAVALETLLREAAAEGKAPADHLAHLVVHGTLHLIGHDHEAGEAEAEAMEALEVEALASIGVADPYRDSRVAEPEAAA
jgi:probable rRNA maturation factor